MSAPQPPSLKTLLALAWPIVISRASQVVVGLSDAWLVADLGASALAATATGATNSFTLLILPMGVCFLVSSFSAQLAGKGDLVRARRFGWYGLLIALATQASTLVASHFIAPAVALMPYSDEVRGLMTGYLVVRLWSSGAAIGLEAFANYYGGLGRTRPAMVANVAAMSLNVLLNWVFIHGHWGAPALGVTGSALASTVATWLAFAALFGFFLFEGRALPRPQLQWRELQRLLRFGLPSGLNWFFEFLAFVFFVNAVVAGLGTPVLAAMNSVLTLSSVAYMPAFGLASAGAILVGQALGRGEQAQVPATVWLTIKTATAWELLVGLVSVAMPTVLLAPFAQGPDGPEVLAAGVGLLMVAAAWQLFDAAASVLAEALRAAGDTLFPLIGRLVIAWAIFAPGAWVSVHVFHATAVQAASWMVLYLALLAAWLGWRFRAGRWRTLQLVEPQVDD